MRVPDFKEPFDIRDILITLKYMQTFRFLISSKNSYFFAFQISFLTRCNILAMTFRDA